MKVQKLITIDVDLAERLLKEANASALINHLVRQHYQNRTPLSEALQAEAEAEAVLEEAVSLRKTAEELQNAEVAVKESSDTQGYNEWKRTQKELMQAHFKEALGRFATEDEMKDYEIMHKQGVGFKKFCEGILQKERIAAGSQYY